MRLVPIAALLLLVTGLAIGQTPTPEQVQVFQNLPPEQQQTMLEQMGGRGDGIAAQGALPRQKAEPAAPRTVPPDQEAPKNVLGAEDLVVVELALPGTMPKGAVRIGNQTDPSVETAPRRLRPEAMLDIETTDRLTRIVELVRSRNPYKLDSQGNLNLPGFPPILLGGLSDEQAVQRLSVEPSLLELDVSLSRLPVNKVGVDALKPFGYDLFDPATSSFMSVGDIPAPADYIIGPGDEFTVQLFGSVSRTHRLAVSREGVVSLPELGPVRVGGMSYSAARTAIQSRVAQQMIGVQANVSIGDMRSIGVFVLGEVRLPGSHAVSGLATITTALFAAGGVSKIGSLRDIQLKRQGQVIRRLDLYDLLMDGNTADDAKLQAGDVVFVPPVGSTVSVSGEVKRPAIYELHGETSANAILQMAGGFTTQADPSRSSLTRVDEQLRRVVLDLDFRAGGAAAKLRNGDSLQVARLRPQVDLGITVDGFVHRQGPMAWRQGMRLSNVIGSIDELKPNADARYILIRRESGADRRIEALSADLLAALARPGSAADVALQPRDRITVFDLAPGRERIIQPLLDELRLQSGPDRQTEVVRISGAVKVAGEYPLEPGMTVVDLLRAGGGLEPSAFGSKAELARYDVDRAGARQTSLIEIDLADVLRGNPAANVSLKPFDSLLIKESQGWSDLEIVTLQGEVKFPGKYPIRRGETLYEVLQRAGGLTSRAFAKGSAFTRAYLKENERKQKEQLADRLSNDLTALSLQAASANQAGASQLLAASQSVLTKLKSAVPVGRMVIDLPGLLAGGQGSAKDVVLRNGDLLVVPMVRQEVSVIGEVQNSASHLFSANLGRADYISLSGGTTTKADKGRIYVVRADGSVVISSHSFFRRGYDVSIQPGDTIVVPLDTERMPRLPLWQAVTQIIYNLAVSVAAVNSF